MQYRSSSSMRSIPRTWPSIRCRRLISASLFSEYPCIRTTIPMGGTGDLTRSDLLLLAFAALASSCGAGSTTAHEMRQRSVRRSHDRRRGAPTHTWARRVPGLGSALDRVLALSEELCVCQTDLADPPRRDRRRTRDCAAGASVGAQRLLR